MELIKTSDSIPIELDDYKERIVVANQIIKLLKTRLLMLKASNVSTHPVLHEDLTKLEFGLMEAINSLRKIAWEQQIVQIASQKGIQSTLLYVANKNFIYSTNLNHVERSVGDHMKSIITESKLLSCTKDFVDEQFREIFDLRNKLMDKPVSNFQKLHKTKKSDLDESKRECLKKLQKKIDNTNKLSMLITGIVGSMLYEEFLPVIVKWRVPRSLSFYQRDCSKE